LGLGGCSRTHKSREQDCSGQECLHLVFHWALHQALFFRQPRPPPLVRKIFRTRTPASRQPMSSFDNRVQGCPLPPLDP
jgi:hypothetical protein